MKTKLEILAEYTENVAIYDKALWKKQSLKKELESLNHQDTKALRAKLRRILKGTAWAIDRCHYYHLINYSTRPITSTIQGAIELYSHPKAPRTYNQFTLKFSPDDEAAILDYVRTITHAAL